MTDIRMLFEFPDFSVDRTGLFKNEVTGTVLKLSRASAGTLKVNFRVNGIIYCRSAAKIVCTMFHGSPKTDETVYYKDGDFQNINADNLEWKSRSFVQEQNAQERRAKSYRDFRVRYDNTGEIFESTLEAARHFGLLERYIALAAVQRNTYYGDSMWSWEHQEPNRKSR